MNFLLISYTYLMCLTFKELRKIDLILQKFDTFSKIDIDDSTALHLFKNEKNLRNINENN